MIRGGGRERRRRRRWMRRRRRQRRRTESMFNRMEKIQEVDDQYDTELTSCSLFSYPKDSTIHNEWKVTSEADLATKLECRPTRMGVSIWPSSAAFNLTSVTLFSLLLKNPSPKSMRRCSILSGFPTGWLKEEPKDDTHLKCVQSISCFQKWSGHSV